MSTSKNASLPLARPAAEDRTGPVHRRSVAGPVEPPASQDTTVIAAVAALVHRYTGESAVAIGRGGAGAVHLAVTGETTLSELHAAVEITPVEAAGTAFHATVVDDADAALAALTVVSAPTGVELLMAVSEFGADAADQYATHLGRALAAAPATRVADIELLDEEDLHRILVAWNQTDEDVPGGFFHEEIAAIAARTPDQDAVVWPGGRLSFGELDAQSTQLAHRLQRLGVGRGDTVGTCFPRGPESLVAQIACFKLGAAAILLDPDFPAERVRFMVEHAAAAVVLTLSAHEHVVAGGSAPVVPVDTTDWRTEPTTPLGVAVEADDFIHICYTSGSTGVPKAVLVRHGAARNLIYSMRTLCGITDRSRGTWLAAPGYGMVEVECFSVLAAGAPVRIPEPSVVTSPEWLRDWFVSEEITHTLLMKAVCERILTLDWPEETALENIRICGERVQSWPAASLPFHVLNLYGSAEATVVAICDITELGQALGADGRARRTPPIGRPTQNVRTFVLGDDLKPVPPGVVGELAIAGDSLSAGYLNQPEATAQKWIPNPIDPDRHPVLYRTGDLARYWPDGDIEIVGRTDNQVKVRGNRVHLGEIEAVLATQPGVGQAAVVAKADDKGDTRLVAYLEADPGREPVVAEVRRALRQKLPTFMVPAAYVVGVFALTTNGKIDRANLPEPPRSRPDVDTDYQEPRTDLERALQQIWADALDLELVGVLDNFFDLGGDSMRAASLTAQIGKRFAVDRELEDLFFELFDSPSIAGMAQAITAMEERAG